MGGFKELDIEKQEKAKRDQKAEIVLGAAEEIFKIAARLDFCRELPTYNKRFRIAEEPQIKKVTVTFRPIKVEYFPVEYDAYNGSTHLLSNSNGDDLDFKE